MVLGPLLHLLPGAEEVFELMSCVKSAFAAQGLQVLAIPARNCHPGHDPGSMLR